MSAAVRWADLERRCFNAPLSIHAWRWVGIPSLCLIALAKPWLFGVAAVALALFALIWRRPHLVVLSFIVLMGNVKVNYYTGLVTLFPEYPILLVASLVGVLKQLERPRALPQTQVLMWFALWTLAGLGSVAFAYNVPRVLSKAMLAVIAAAIFELTVLSLRNRRDLDRALNWLTASASLVATYGIVQMAGVFLGIDTSLGFLRRWGNPEFEYSVGAPVLYRLTSTFRANSLFNDPNILGGYLAAVLPLIVVRLLTPRQGRTRMVLVGETAAFLLVLFCLLLTLSRSGFLGAFLGVAVALVFLPEALRRGRLWFGLVAGGTAAVAASAAIGVNALVLLGRLNSALEGTEFSAQVHRDLFRYGLELFARYPLTGIGFHNFGEYYAREVDPTASNMMAHNMWLSNFAEAGLVGGIAYVMLCWAIGSQPFRVARSPEARRRDPYLHTAVAGLFGGLIALAVTNAFYDFSLRTFVWVFAGLAVAASRFVSMEPAC